MNILKMIGQQAVNAALPTVKAELKQRALTLSTDKKYASISILILPFINDLLDNWTIKL